MSVYPRILFIYLKKQLNQFILRIRSPIYQVVEEKIRALVNIRKGNKTLEPNPSNEIILALEYFSRLNGAHLKKGNYDATPPTIEFYGIQEYVLCNQPTTRLEIYQFVSSTFFAKLMAHFNT